MIEMIYKEEKYEYEGIGCKPYDITVKLELKKDANINEAMATFLKLLTISEYKINKENILRAVYEYFDTDYYN